MASSMRCDGEARLDGGRAASPVFAPLSWVVMVSQKDLKRPRSNVHRPFLRSPAPRGLRTFTPLSARQEFHGWSRGFAGAYNTVHHVRPWLVRCEAGRALPPADRLAAFVPFEKHLRRLSDARSAERGGLIEDISARHRRHATDTRTMCRDCS
jgi:hypothetical protein